MFLFLRIYRIIIGRDSKIINIFVVIKIFRVMIGWVLFVVIVFMRGLIWFVLIFDMMVDNVKVLIIIFFNFIICKK